MTRITSHKNPLPPGEQSTNDIIASSDDLSPSIPQPLSAIHGSRTISTSLALVIKKVTEEVEAKERLCENGHKSSGHSSDAAPIPLLPKRLFAPSEYTPGFEVSHVRTRLESEREESGSDDTDDEKQSQAYVYNRAQDSISTKERDFLRGSHLLLEQIEASRDAESDGEEAVNEEKDNEPGTEDGTMVPRELNQIPDPEDDLLVAAAEQNDNQPVTTSKQVSKTKPNRGQVFSPALLSCLLPVEIGMGCRFICLSNHYLDKDGNWFVEDEACNRHLSTRQIYLQHVEEEHIGIERKWQIADWVNKFRSEYISAANDPFVVLGTRELKRKIAERERKVGTGKRRKKVVIDVEAAGDRAWTISTPLSLQAIAGLIIA